MRRVPLVRMGLLGNGQHRSRRRRQLLVEAALAVSNDDVPRVRRPHRLQLAVNVDGFGGCFAPIYLSIIITQQQKHAAAAARGHVVIAPPRGSS